MAARRGCDAFPSEFGPRRRISRFFIAGILSTALTTIAVPPVQAQDELLINDDRLPRAQFAPRPARGLTGSLVIAWSDGRNGADASIDYDIYAVTIRDPLALGSTVNRRINDDVGGAFQGSPDISSSPTGTLFCVWEDNRASNPDVYGAALDSLGFRTTPNLRINDDSGFGEQRSPHVTPVGPDHYLVVWGDQRAGQSDIYGSYRNVSGAPLGANFIISPDPVTGGSFQGEPAVACNANGLTLVVWLDGREGGSVFGSTFDIYGQWIDAAGSLIGGNFKINSTTGAQQDASPTVVADPTLGFVVAWVDRRLGTSIDPGDVYAQRFGPDRSLVGVNVRVNDDPLGRNQKNVRSAPGPDAAHLFWEDQRDAFGLDSNVLSARLAYDSSAPGANFRVNANTPGRQGTPSAVWDGRDAFLTTWEDTRNGAPDIYAISFLPNGTRRGFDTQMNDDAARNDQWRPRLGRGNGEFLLTWIDRRNRSNDLFCQWVGANGGREGTNSLLYQDTGLTRPVASNAAVAPNGSALVAAQVTRDSDAGEVRGFLFLTMGNGPAFTFWISDSLQSTQAEPVVAARPGEFAVAWIDSRGLAPAIYGQRISAAGARLGQNHPLLFTNPSDPPYALDLALDDFAGGYWLLYAEGASADQRLWLAHLDSSLQPDGAPVAVAPGFAAGPRQDPKLSTSPADGRLEVVWQGVNASGLGAVYHLALTSGLVPLGPVFEVGDTGFTGARAKPSIFLLDSRSVVTWQEKRDGNWSIWMSELQGGVTPMSGAVRVDEDPGQADQLDPGVGLDAAGNAIFVWADLRSISSGSDILARVIELTPTSVDDLPSPDPEPPPAPPSRMRLGPARPNPFGGILRVPLEVPAGPGARVRAYVLDVRGALVANVYDGDAGGGRLLLRWGGLDGHGREVASGVYWFVAESGGERHAVRLVRIR